MKTKNYVGKTFAHSDLGLVIVDNTVSRVKVEVTCIDRGKGWNEFKERYVGYTNKIGWMRGENRQYLHKDVVHINSLQ